MIGEENFEEYGPVRSIEFTVKEENFLRAYAAVRGYEAVDPSDVICFSLCELIKEAMADEVSSLHQNRDETAPRLHAPQLP